MESFFAREGLGLGGREGPEAERPSAPPRTTVCRIRAECVCVCEDSVTQARPQAVPVPPSQQHLL